MNPSDLETVIDRAGVARLDLLRLAAVLGAEDDVLMPRHELAISRARTAAVALEGLRLALGDLVRETE